LAIRKPGNEASQRLLEKFGFRFERLVKMNDSFEEDEVYVVDLSA
jgi:RimJ/RimL family protein N-acetyltransferase